MAYRTQIYESGIVRVIKTGDGHDWIKAKADRIESVARARVPIRTGRLLNSHRVTQNRNSLGRYQTGFVVSANTSYAAYVHEGTGIHGPRGTPITSRRGMRIPGHNLKRTGSRSTVVRIVLGQPAKPWLAQAAASVVGV